MKTLYLDCGMGAAGDMLSAALLELLPEPEGFVRRLNALGIPGVRYTAQRAEKCGVVGTRLCVTVDGAQEEAHEHEHEHEHHHEHHHHAHHTVEDIRRLVISHLALPDVVKRDVLAVYGLLADAESRVHGVSVEQIHFHEVGTMDALADVAAVCLLVHELAPQTIAASPVHVGFGQVRCAHGILPVPAPATAQLLRGVPICGGEIEGELCTPTGAALLRYFVRQFGDMPTMRVDTIGNGMGTKDFPRANCVRALLGETADDTDTALELSCNVDDMTAEDVAFAAEQLLAGGALDVYTAAIGMKKSRPGTKICVLCRPQDREKCMALLFRHTSTLGVREASLRRTVLRRKTQTCETPFGPVRRKTASGCGVSREKYEYEDLAQIARERDMSLAEVRAAIDTRDGAGK